MTNKDNWIWSVIFFGIMAVISAVMNTEFTFITVAIMLWLAADPFTIVAYCNLIKNSSLFSARCKLFCFLLFNNILLSILIINIWLNNDFGIFNAIVIVLYIPIAVHRAIKSVDYDTKTV